jgi:hypothetical protein
VRGFVRRVFLIIRYKKKGSLYSVLTGIALFGLFGSVGVRTKAPALWTNFALRNNGRYEVQHIPEKQNIPYNSSHLSERLTNRENAGIFPINPINDSPCSCPKGIILNPGIWTNRQVVIITSDLHIGVSHSGAPYCPETTMRRIESIVGSVCKENPESYLVVSGDSAPRNHRQKFLTARLIQFFRNLNAACRGRFIVGLGNHDTQNPNDFFEFLVFLNDNGIKVITHMKPWIETDATALIAAGVNAELAQRVPALVNLLLDYYIDGNTVYFSYCLNSANCGNCGVFIQSASRSLDNIERDRYFKDGRPDQLTYSYEDYLTRIARKLARIRQQVVQNGWQDEMPGRVNILVRDWAEKLKSALSELARRNPPGARLAVVFVAHEYYLKFLTFIEQISLMIPGWVDPEIWKRLDIVLACGHSHLVYSVQQNVYVQDANGNMMAIPVRALSPACYGQYLGMATIARSFGDQRETN